jgi:hypothetical protein
VESFPRWQASLDVPPGSLTSLNDDQCTARCDEGSSPAPGEESQVLPGTAASTKLLDPVDISV